jgi:hypothetical protein
MSVRRPLRPARLSVAGREWRARMEADAQRITLLLPARLAELHRAVVERSGEADADSLILSGSTARGARTEISDLDYHLIGSPIHTADLSRELDLHVLTADKLMSHVRDGDDFVHWSLRFGLVIFDRGPVRHAVSIIEREGLRPDPERKRAHATKSIELARRFLVTGDEDGALVQVRTALSLAARAYLLAIGVFPLSRTELPAQLREVGKDEAGDALAQTIEGAPTMEGLERGVEYGAALLRR